MRPKVSAYNDGDDDCDDDCDNVDRDNDDCDQRLITLLIIMTIVIINVVFVHHALTTPSVSILENLQGHELSAAAAHASSSLSATSYTSPCMLHNGGTLRTRLSMHQAEPEDMRSCLVL